MYSLEELAERFEDITPYPGLKSVNPLMFATNQVLTNFLRHEIKFNEETWERLLYEQHNEWVLRVDHAVELCNRVIKEKPSKEELYTTKWLAYLSHPPAALCSADVGFASAQLIFGPSVTIEYHHVDDWTGEVLWIDGYHNEEGVPVHRWVVGVCDKMARFFDDIDRKLYRQSGPTWTVPASLDEALNRRHLRTGVKIRDLPRKYLDMEVWNSHIHDVISDERIELFPQWSNAFLSVVGVFASAITSTQCALTAGQMNATYWDGLNAVRLMGFPRDMYVWTPYPAIFRTLYDLPREHLAKRAQSLNLGGCEAFLKLITPEERAPLTYKFKRYVIEKGPRLRECIPPRVGFPTPDQAARAIPPVLKECYIKQFLITPPNEEYWEILESEGNIDRKTGRIPPYQETGRILPILDPTVEFLRMEDFPPLDLNEGQIWPYDITRDKVRVMVKLGYDGTGVNMEYYSKEADDLIRRGKA